MPIQAPSVATIGDDLDAIHRFARAIPSAPWFAAAGEPLSAAEREEAGLYLTGLGRSGIAVAAAPDWLAARAIASDPGWDRSWWEAEEVLRASLTETAGRRHSGGGLHQVLEPVIRAIGDTAQGAASVAAGRAGIVDAALVKCAAGAASQACHHGALALVAGAGADHPFAAKLRLFEGGRWVLGIVGGTLHVL